MPTSEPSLPLAPRDLLILAVLAEGPLHGYGLIKAVERRSSSRLEAVLAQARPAIAGDA